MIITRTPLRISLVGGGTDMPGFYYREFGAVVSFAINKYIYVSVNEKFDGKVRVSYSETENVSRPLELKHDIVRETLHYYHQDGLEITSVADVPGSGTGLGSSSAFTVGLVRALDPHKNRHPDFYAKEAYHIERILCRHSCGKQDHWAASYGGVHLYRFMPDEEVIAEDLNLKADTLIELQNHFTLLWTGRGRSSKKILADQEKVLEGHRWDLARVMRDMAIQLKNDLRDGDISNIGQYLDANWQIKRQMAHGITDGWIDRKYDQAIAAGAEGGKICGAGGGGFFLFYGPLGIGPKLEQATRLRRVPFEIELEGSKVIYE